MKNCKKKRSFSKEMNRHLYNKELVFYECKKLTKKLNRPKNRDNRGRRVVYCWNLYTAIFMFMTYFKLTYREAEQDLNLFLLTTPNFRSIWYSVRKVPDEQIKYMLSKIKEEIFKILLMDKQFYIMDSSGIRYRSKDVNLKYKRGEENKKRVGHSKVCCLVVYVNDRRAKRKGRVVVTDGAVGGAYESDHKLAQDILKQTKEVKNKKLLIDKGFDGEKTLERLLAKGYQPIIPLKKQGTMKSKIRKKVKKYFNKKLYKYRGIIEGVFGAIRTRYDKKTQSFRTDMAKKQALMIMCVYNLSLYLKLLVIFFIIKFFIGQAQYNLWCLINQKFL